MQKGITAPFCVQPRKRGNMNSFMSWVGGKKALRDAIVARLDERCDRYVEVFGGGGWVLFHKRPSKFEVYNDKAGEFRFRLKATNGQVIATSEGYKALTGCMNGIESVKKNAVDAKIVTEE